MSQYSCFTVYEKYADGYNQLSLFNEAEQETDPDAPEPEMEEFLQGRYAPGDATRVQYHRNCAYEWTEAIQLSLTYDGKNERFRCVSGK